VIQSVRYEQLSDSIGYIQIRQFQSDTTQDVMDALDALLLNDLTGLVLDLRDNPGGTLSSAIGVSDLFLSDNTIVSTRGRLEAMNQEIKATPNEYFANKPIVVLINGGSASASEIVAGALQDTKRAIVMGVKSFGKGSVQSILEHDNVAIKLTTARYYTPSGHSIQGLGITPDIEVAVTQISGSQAKQLFSERSLYGALKGEDKAPDKHSTPPSSLAESDYQLYEAVNLLVALNLYAKLNQ
jgi:carboxyl-terminal processing protease